MGHEASGTVYSVGSSVASLKPGDRVAIEPGFPCRRCKACKSGRYNLCTKMTFAASPPDSPGTLTKYFRLPDDFCYKIPDAMGLDEAVLIEPLSVAVHVARLADVKAGTDVVIFGAGTIGLMCAAVVKAFGAKKIISVDLDKRRLEFAEKFAATATFEPIRGLSAEETAGQMIKQFGLSEGADTVLEATGAASCIDTGISVLRTGGTFVQVGLGNSRIEFPIVLMSEKELNLKGSFRYNSGDYELALNLATSGKVAVGDLITHTEPFERASEAWERTRRGEGIKTLIRGPRGS